MREEVADFNFIMPKDTMDCIQDIQMTVRGKKAVKTVTRTCRLYDGTIKVLTVVQERQIYKIAGQPSVMSRP